MRRARVLALAALLGPSPAAAEPGDVPWYAERHAERRAKLEWCARDAARQATRECQNAKAAGAVELMSPGNPWGRLPTWRPPGAPPVPQVPAPMPPVQEPPPPAARPLRRAT